MFGEQFYPTPKPLIKKMLQPFIKEGKISRRYGMSTYEDDYTHMKQRDFVMLEPSAGKGDICNYVKELAGDQAEIFCIEIDKNLQHILQEGGYRVIADDFLNYNGDYHFDLIVMNPPFATGDKHLLKAWDLLEEGDIACLLNTETLNNPHTTSRRLLLSIIEQHGTIEHVGPAFEDAERKTSVDVSIVRLHKQAKEGRFKFEFKNVTKETPYKLDENTFTNPIATRDVIGNMMIQFENLKSSFVEFLKAREKMNFYSQGIFDKAGTTSMWELIKNLNYTSNGHAFNDLSHKVKMEMWMQVLTKTNIEKFMTHDVRTNFSKFLKAQGCLDFTKENIAQVIQFIFENRYEILDKAVDSVFDTFTMYHKENRCYVEGWKTNDKYKVNRKIILPYGVSYGSYCDANTLKQYGDKFSNNYNRRSEYSDIDKVMCYLSGTDYDTCYTIYTALDRAFERLGHVRTGDSFDATCESEFFTMRFFKKGTLHLEFKDEWLWQEFNMRACANKNWLPDEERKAYEEENKKSRAKAREEAAAFTKQLLLPSSPVIVETPPAPEPEAPRPKRKREFLQPSLF